MQERTFDTASLPFWICITLNSVSSTWMPSSLFHSQIKWRSERGKFHFPKPKTWNRFSHSVLGNPVFTECQSNRMSDFICVSYQSCFTGLYVHFRPKAEFLSKKYLCHGYSYVADIFFQTYNNFTHQGTKCSQQLVAGSPTIFGVMWQMCTLNVSTRNKRSKMSMIKPSSKCAEFTTIPFITSSQSITLVLYKKKLWILLPTTHSFSRSQNCKERLLASSFLSVCLSVRPSVRPSAWNNSVRTGRISITFYIWVSFENLQKIQVSLQSDKNSRYFTWRRMYVYDNISLNSS